MLTLAFDPTVERLGLSRSTLSCLVAATVVLAGCSGQANNTSGQSAEISRLLTLCKATRTEIDAISRHAFSGPAVAGKPYELGPRFVRAADQVAVRLAATGTEIRAAGLHGSEAEAALKRLAEHQAGMVQLAHEIRRENRERPRNVGGWHALYHERALGCGYRPAN